MSKLENVVNSLKSTTQNNQTQPIAIQGVRSSNTVARDITMDFTAAASSTKSRVIWKTTRCLMFAGLSTGQLVKDGFFTLFEAVGALEVRT